MKMYWLVFLTILLVGCGDKVERQGDASLQEGDHYKALELYKECLKRRPSDEALSQKIEQCTTNLVMNAYMLIHQMKYQEAIDYLAPLLNELEHCPVDAYILTALAHFYGFSDRVEKIEKGLALLNQVLRKANRHLKVPGMSIEMLKWLEELGIQRQDIEARSFQADDFGVIYRAFLFHRTGSKIVRSHPIPSFPVPSHLKPNEKQKLAHLYGLFSWMMHHFMISPDNPFDYPALPPDILIRGFGTLEECCVLFVHLCLQADIPAYLVTPRKKDGAWLEPLAMAQVGDQVVVFDFRRASPLLDEKNELWAMHSAHSNPAHSEISQESIKNGIFWVVVPPKSIFPRFFVLPELFKLFEVIPPPYFYLSPYRLGEIVKKGILKDQALSYDYLHPKKEGACVAFYPKLFRLWSDYNEKTEKRKRLHEKRAASLFFLEARMAQLRGEKDALEKYRKRGGEGPTGYLEYWECSLSMALQKDIPEAEKLALEYSKAYPSLSWNDMLEAQLGLACVQKNKPEAAKANYRKSGLFPEHAIPFYVSAIPFENP